MRWAVERAAQEILPGPVRRLVLASVSPLRIDLPAADTVIRPGGDGFLEVVDGPAFVSAGQSVWPMGVGPKAGRESRNDYSTRTANSGNVIPSETICFFVTPRRREGTGQRFASKEPEWTGAAVRVLDADDLEQGLDLGDAVTGGHPGRSPRPHRLSLPVTSPRSVHH